MANHEERKRILDEAVSLSNLGSKTWCGQTYNNVFTGGTLVTILMKDSMKYRDRKTAVQYSQGLLDSHAIISITKRGAFDDGDRLYYINQDATNDDKRTTVPAKGLVTKEATEKKVTFSKETHQQTNSSGSYQKSVVLLDKEQHTASSSVRPSSDLQRLLAKDTVSVHVRTSSGAKITVEPSVKHSAKKGPQSVSVVLKDKQAEGDKDEKLTEKINSSSNRLNAFKPQSSKTALSGTATTSKSTLDLARSGADGGLKERLSPDMGNSITSCFKDRESAKITKVEHATTSSNNKEKLAKKISPALSALIEKDARNSQVKTLETKEDTNVKEVPDTAPKMNGETDKLSNSWDAFELKLQNQIKNSSPRKTSGGDNVGHDNIEKGESSGKNNPVTKNTSKVSENNNEVLTFTLEPKKCLFSKEVRPDSVTGITSGVSNAGYFKDNLKGHGKLTPGGVLSTSVAERKSSFLSAQEHTKKDGVGIERVPSVTLSGGSKTVIIDDESCYVGRQGNDVSIGTKDPGRARGPSFSRHDAMTVVIEDDIEGRSTRSSSFTAKEKPGSRKSSFNSKNEAKLTVATSENTKLGSTDEKKYSVQRKTSKTMGESSPTDHSHSTSHDEVMKVNGQLLPNTLASLLAKDGSATEKKNTGDNETNDFQNKLKELKKGGSRSNNVNLKNERHNSEEYGRDTMGRLGEREDSPGKKDHNENDIPKSHAKKQSTASNLYVFRSSSVGERASMIERKTSQGSTGDNKRTLADNKGTFGDHKGTVGDHKETAVGHQGAAGDHKSIAVDHEGFAVDHKGFAGDHRADDKVRTCDNKVTIVDKNGITGDKKGTTMTLSSVSATTSADVSHSKPRSPVSPSSSYAIPRLNLTREDATSASSSSATRPSTLSVSSASESSTHLRKELEKARQEYEERRQSYETKITELQLQIDYLRRQNNGEIHENGNGLESSASTSELTSLYSSFSTPVVSPGNSTMTSPAITPRGSMAEDSYILSPKSPPPPPPAPPSVPLVGTPTGALVRPTKPVVNPRTEMKPLFWNRIVSSEDAESETKSVWKSIREPVIDVNEFERLFSKKTADRKLKRTKSLRDDKHFTRINGKKVAKLLDANRSRAIGIKMSSLNCQLKDIRNAVYNMDTSVVDMESLQLIYDIYPKENEIQLIDDHMKKLPSVPLDKPEEFMYQLTLMKHFKERLECWLFEEKFTEIIFGIDRSLTCVTESCSIITSNTEIITLLGLILAFGNYMNGNTMRGQADGFHLEVLLKLRDVKTKDTDLSLLQYIVKQYMKEQGKSGESMLPSSVSLSNAAQVSFDTLKEELLKVTSLLKETEQQANKIVDECSPDQRNPFEEKMRKFQTSAKHKIAEANHKTEKAQDAFGEAMEYFQWEPEGKKKSPQEFFTLWAKFMEEVKNCIKTEKQHQQLTKKNFRKVEHLNQIREAATKFRKRRQSVDNII